MAKSKYCFTKVLILPMMDTIQINGKLSNGKHSGYSFGNTTAKPIIGSAEYVDKIVDLYNKVLEVDFKDNKSININNGIWRLSNENYTTRKTI